MPNRPYSIRLRSFGGLLGRGFLSGCDTAGIRRVAVGFGRGRCLGGLLRHLWPGCGRSTLRARCAGSTWRASRAWRSLASAAQSADQACEYHNRGIPGCSFPHCFHRDFVFLVLDSSSTAAARALRPCALPSVNASRVPREIFGKFLLPRQILVVAAAKMDTEPRSQARGEWVGWENLHRRQVIRGRHRQRAALRV